MTISTRNLRVLVSSRCTTNFVRNANQSMEQAVVNTENYITEQLRTSTSYEIVGD